MKNAMIQLFMYGVVGFVIMPLSLQEITLNSLIQNRQTHLVPGVWPRTLIDDIEQANERTTVVCTVNFSENFGLKGPLKSYSGDVFVQVGKYVYDA